MKPILPILFLSLILLSLLAAPLAAGELSQADRQKLLDHLDHTRQLFLESVEGLSEEQWQFKAAEDRWSIAQCAQHIAMSEKFIRDTIVKAIESGEAAEGVEAMDEQVLAMIVDRSQQFNAPEPLQPAAEETWSPAESLKTFKEERANTRQMAEEAGDLRATGAAHPAGFTLDSYGWFLFLSGHTQRHILQIEEVKEAPGFPAS